MNKRLLGASGYEIGEIGLGCWQFGGDFGPMEEETALQIMAVAVESGVDFFDTADVYGNGRSEALIGRFLRESRADIRVATKFGRSANTYPDNYTLDVLREVVNGSRHRIGVDTIDLLQLHCIPIEVLHDGAIFDHLRSIQQEGLIAQFGVSVETVEQAQLCLAQDGVQSLQIIFNLLRQTMMEAVLPAAKEKEVGIIVRLPLASGLLAGKYSAETTFPDSDHRNYNRDGDAFYVGETFAGLPFQTGVELIESVRPRVPEPMTMAQMAMRWVLDHDAVSVVIPGASSVAQAQANAAVSQFAPLASDLHQWSNHFYQNQVAQHIRGLL